MFSSRWFTLNNMAPKRKHDEATSQKKFNALKELEKGRSNKDVAGEYNIPPSTLTTWKKNKEKIFEAFKNSSLKRQRIKPEKYDKLNEALLKWFKSITHCKQQYSKKDVNDF